jgi:hypothetical protein
LKNDENILLYRWLEGLIIRIPEIAKIELRIGINHSFQVYEALAGGLMSQETDINHVLRRSGITPGSGGVFVIGVKI